MARVMKLCNVCSNTADENDNLKKCLLCYQGCHAVCLHLRSSHFDNKKSNTAIVMSSQQSCKKMVILVKLQFYLKIRQ